VSATAPSRRRAAADALLAREYDELKPEIVGTVAGKLAASGVRLPDPDLDAAYNQAWHAVHTKLAEGEQVDNPKGLLVAVAHRRALDEHRAHHPSRFAGEERIDELAAESDVDQRLDDTTRLRQFVSGLRERLDRRELEAAALCYLYDYSRPEAARLIGVQPKRMEKIMDAVSKKLAPMVGEIREGEWCERHRSLVKAYAFELLDEDGERHQLARDHLEHCSSCRRSVLRLRGIAAVAPPVPLLLGAAGLLGIGAAAAGRSAAGGSSAPAPHAGGAVRRVLSEQRTKLALAGATVAAVIAALALTLGGGEGDAGPATPPAAAPPAAREQAAQDARAAAARRERARAAAAKARRERAAATRRRAAARARRAAARPSVAATAPTPPVQPAPPVAAPQPAAPAPAAPEPVPPRGPTRDGAEEFELR
jgi:DNA-directed RNA polymerase specialized sigma24 family protein